MKVELVGGPLDGSFVDEEELPPEGVRTNYYVARGDGTADCYRLRRARGDVEPPVEFAYTGLVPWGMLRGDEYPTD